MILKFIKYSIFCCALFINFNSQSLSLKLKSLDTKKPPAPNAETQKAVPIAIDDKKPIAQEPKKEFKFSALPIDSGKATPVVATPPPPSPQSGAKINAFSAKKTEPVTPSTTSIQPIQTTEPILQVQDPLKNDLTPQSPPTEKEKAKVEDDFSLEKVEQSNRNWQESPNERTTYMNEASDYHKKIIELVKNTNKTMTEKAKSAEEINSQLNQTYSQASSTMGNFVEIGRKIEDYVHTQIEKYAEQKS